MNRNVVKRRACQTCRERRIKCDLTQPACLQCTQNLRECLGYPDSFQFRNETSKIKRRAHRYATNNVSCPEQTMIIENLFDELHATDPMVTAFDNNVDSIHGTCSPTGISTFQGGLVPIWDDVSINPNEENESAESGKHAFQGSLQNSVMVSHLPAALASPDAYLRQTFALFANFMMRAPQHDALPRMTAGSSWVNYVIDQTGQHHLLDSSMKAVSLAYLGMTRPDLRESSRPYYGQAIRRLNASLVPQDHDKFVTTLSATMLLSFFEMFMSDEQFSWIHHAGGAAAMMRFRGASAFRTGPARNIFLLYRHHIIIQATYKGQACFLAQPEWRQLSSDILSDLKAIRANPRHIQVWEAANALLHASARVPGLMSSFKSYGESRDASRGSTTNRENQLQQGRHVLHALMRAFRQFSQVLKSIGHTPIEVASPGPTTQLSLSYANMYVALYYIQYWTNVMVMNNLLQPLGLPPDEAEELRTMAKTAATKCLQSLGHVKQADLLSSLTFEFTLRLARGFVDSEEKRMTMEDRIGAISGAQVGSRPTTDYLNSL